DGHAPPRPALLVRVLPAVRLFARALTAVLPRPGNIGNADGKVAFPTGLPSDRDRASEEEEQAQRALRERPRVSIRTRIGVVFLPLFLLLCAITLAAVLFVSRLGTRQQFLEKASNLAFEIQQARRFEKNFFLYGTNLTDALNNVHNADSELERSADEFRSVVGDGRYQRMRQSLTEYGGLLDELLASTRTGVAPESAERRGVESRLRRAGALILADSEEMVDKERLSMGSALHTFTVVAIAFLLMMLASMAFVAGFLTRAVLTPLARFVSYTARIGAGDYTPIRPARKYRDEFSDLAIAVNQMLQELKVRQEQLLQAGKMAAVGTLTSGIAHEINNPLNNIALTTESLIDEFQDYSDEDKIRMLRQLYTQVERAGSTVRNLLDFTRKETPAFTTVTVQDVIGSTLRLVSNELKLGQVESYLELPPDLPKVSGNPRNLQQVFLNLFLNAIQAMPDGGKLTVRATVQEDQLLRVDVSDTGVGIPPENLGKVFDPFFTTKEPGQGTGLGLSVSYGIIEKHRGRITVSSKVGEGTTFSVFLPLKAEERTLAPAVAGDERR
ncbi:MAG TPA: ATP-binding protein, partial [Chloroflexota bacterium]